MSQLNENNLANRHVIASLHFIKTTRKDVMDKFFKFTFSIRRYVAKIKVYLSL